MTERHTHNHPAHLDTTDARAGKAGVGLKWVLGVSLVMVVAVLGLVYMGFLAG